MFIGTFLLFDYIEASVMRVMRVSLVFFVAVFTFTKLIWNRGMENGKSTSHWRRRRSICSNT